MLRMFDKERMDSCYIIFMSSANSALQIELLKQGKFNHLFIRAPNDTEPNAYFSSQFQLFTSLQEAEKKLSQHKDLHRVYILEMKNGVEKTRLLAAQGKFSEGIQNIIEGSTREFKLLKAEVCKSRS